MSIRFRRQLLCGLLIFVTFVATDESVHEAIAAGTDIDADFRDPNEASPGYQIVILKDQSPVAGFSYLMDGSQPGSWGVTCSSIETDPCSGDHTGVWYKALLQPCQNETQLDCISGFGAASEANEVSPASFLGNFPTVGRHDFSGDPSIKLPTGGPSTLWLVPSLPHSGGAVYMVQVQTGGMFQNGSFSMSEFGIEIFPIELVDDICPHGDRWPPPCPEDQGLGFYDVPIADIEYDDEGNELPRRTQRGLAARVSGSNYDCVFLAQNQCARRHAFPQDARFNLKVRLSQSPKGWLHGRISKPNVAINPLSGSAVELDVTASTVKTPVVATSTPWSNLPSVLQDAYRATGGFKGGPAGTRNRPTFESGPEIRNAISAPTSYSETGMEELIAWIPYINDKSTADISKWTLRSLTDGELAGAASCFTNTSQLNGLVMTNATQYTAGPPKFDRAAGSLDYRVAAPHYTSGGNVFLGTYDLIMRSDVARCIYGFTKAPLNASISVVDNDGVTTTATKLVSERDGWIRIAAYGFGFSSPTVKVKFTQEAAKAPASPSKKITITCKKGKLVKKVTAIKPVCPKGYKKA